MGKALLTLCLLAVLSVAGVAIFVWQDSKNLLAQPNGLAEIIQLAQADELLDPDTAASPGEAMSTEESADAAPQNTAPKALLNPEQLGETEAHLCFFSLNNPWEYRRMRWFTDAINKHSPIKIKVSEYQVMDADPEDSFLNVIRSGVRCDGVVLSGHFTDEYYGDRADGDLTMDDLEEMSCKPGFSSWFAQVNALWLQGCNTIKYREHNEDVDDDDRISGSPLPFMARMIDPEDMEDSIEDMYDLLLENTNDENYAVHFQRIFPESTVYGWTNTAPGEKAGSDRSIPYHIAQCSRVIDSDPRVFSNPITSDIPPAAARRYAEVLYGLLKRPLTPREDFPTELVEKNFIQGWRDHGSHRYRYAFDNPSVRGYPALSHSRDEVLRQTKGLACLRRQVDNMEDPPNMLQLARHILRDPQLYEYSSYTLEALLRRAGPQIRGQIEAQMRATDGFMRYLEKAQQAEGYRGQDAQRLFARIKPARPKAESEAAEQAMAE
ncbi:MAG: hypothetical protein ACPHER_01840 [Nevskiales bacterium]